MSKLELPNWHDWVDEQDVLDTYVKAMNKIWKNKSPEERAKMLAEVNADPNTAALRKIYAKVLENIKSFCPDLNKELGYKEWTPEVKARVNAWINIVLAGNDPVVPVVTDAANTVSTTEVSTVTTMETPDADNNDDLPF